MADATDEQLSLWKSDILAFVRDNLFIENPLTGKVEPMKLYPHHKRWLREATRRDKDGNLVYTRAVACWPKRDGKTNCVAVLLIWRMFVFGADQHMGILSNSKEQSEGNVFTAICNIVLNSPRLAEMVPGTAMQRFTIRVPDFNNEVKCYQNNFRTIQGKAFKVLACDELHAVDDGGKAWHFASNQTEALNAQAVICSQAGLPIEENPMYKLYQARHEPTVFFDYRETVETPWAKVMCEREKKILPAAEWRYLWTNAWGAGADSLFEKELIDTAFRDLPEITSAAEWQDLKLRLAPQCVRVRMGVGVDRGGKGKTGSRTVWTVAAGLYSQGAMPVHVIVRQRVFDSATEEDILIEEQITRGLFGQSIRIIFEAWGCGDLAAKVRGATTESATEQSQDRIMTHLRELMVEGRLAIPQYLTDLHTEITLFKWQFRGENRRSRWPKYGVGQGRDDTVYSTAWALEACDAPMIRQQEARSLKPVEPSREIQQLLANLRTY